jgi:uncharacterized Zn-binding protein involved in type VI secretion
VGDAIHGPEPVASPDPTALTATTVPASTATSLARVAVTAGSPDVFVNGFAALRVDDGGDGWQASAGSTGVFINGKPAVRAGDATSHGGASGAVASGSADVSFGDAAPGTPNDRPHDRSVQLSFVDALGREVEDLVVEVFCPHQPLSTQPASGSATITGLCSSANVSVHKALQAGEWDDSASQGPNPMTIMSAHTNGTGGVEAPSGGEGGASASTTVHAPGPSGTSSSQQTVNVPATNGGSTAVQYTTVHNWMQLVYHAFGHNLPTEDHHMALLGVREASLSGPGRSSEAHVEKLESEAAHGDVAHVSFTREKRAQSYNDLLFAAYADRHVKTKQVVDVYECTIDASPSHGKLELPYILEGHMLHATPSGFESYPGKHIALELFRGAHAPKAPEGGSAKAVLDLAHKQLGTKETSTNYTKYNEWYPAPAEYWCAIFVSWIFCHSGFPEVRYTYCGNGADAFKSGAWGTWHGSDATAKPGDIVFYNWHDGGLAWDHTGIVVSDQGSTITAIEGNTSNGSPGAPDDGVYLRSNRPKSLINGFGRVKFKDVAPAVPVIRWGGEGRRVREKSEKDSTLLHHRYFDYKHGKYVVDKDAKRYAHFMHTFNDVKNKDKIPYLVVSSQYVKSYAEWVKWVDAHPGKPTASSVLRTGGLRSPKDHTKYFLPSFLSKSYVDRTFDHIARMHDRHEAHKLRDELEAALLQLSVKI